MDQVEQTDRCGQISSGDLAALRDGPDRVVDLGAGVPHRIPQPVGERVEVLLAQSPSVVQQHQVVVAQRPGVSSRDTADRCEREARGRHTLRCLVPALGEPRASEVGKGRAARLAGTRGGEAAGAGQVQPLLGDVGHAVRLPRDQRVPSVCVSG